LHVTWGGTDFTGPPGHIPGAWLLDGLDAVDATSAYKNMLPPTDQFEK
jgi:3-mercaptopyruvate sulfurtransferase SseA